MLVRTARYTVPVKYVLGCFVVVRSTQFTYIDIKSTCLVKEKKKTYKNKVNNSKKIMTR